MARTVREDIKQTKPFAYLTGEAMVSLMRTAAVLGHQAEEALKPYGITGTQYNVLRILRGAGAAGLCGREVGERMITRVPDVSRLLDRMEHQGLIKRERDSADRRHVTTRITAAGGKVLEQTTPVVDAMEAKWFGKLDPKLLRTVIDALNEVRDVD